MSGNQRSLAGYLVLNHLIPSNLGSVRGEVGRFTELVAQGNLVT